MSCYFRPTTSTIGEPFTMLSFTSKIIAALIGAAAVDAIPLVHRSSDTGSFDLPLTWTSFGFVTDSISIGTPPQSVPSFVDWTWVGRYVFSTLCHDPSSRTHACLATNQSIFNQSQSSTFENRSSLYPARTWNPNHFFFYDNLSVEYGSDVERIGPNEARTTLMLADMDFSISEPYPFTGVYGLSPVSKTDNRKTTLVC